VSLFVDVVLKTIVQLQSVNSVFL